jgi:transcriptional regulator with XRE-family HTH domain
MDTSSITDRIASALAESQLEQAELARRVGVSRQAVNDWLKGRSVNIRPETLVRLADVLGVEIRWLATGHGPRKADPPPRDYVEILRKLDAMSPDERAAYVLLLSRSNPVR